MELATCGCIDEVTGHRFDGEMSDDAGQTTPAQVGAIYYRQDVPAHTAVTHPIVRAVSEPG